MRNTKFCGSLIVLVVLVGTLCLSLAISSLMTSITIGSSGQLFYPSSIPTMTAASGSARDIQAAVDWIVAHGGIGNVHIPEGIFNFVGIGEPWMTVDIPPGVSIFGAPTQRDANDQVIEWKTVLVMPYEVPTTGPDDNPMWFKVGAKSDGSSLPFRFSDIKLVGWRFYDTSSTTMYTGLYIYDAPYDPPGQTAGIADFRVDHCNFQDIAGSAISIAPGHSQYNRRVISGVVDHNRFVNSYGNPGRLPVPYESRTIGYGVGMRRWASDFWDSNLDNVVGHYNNYTIVIEDNYFSKWRHSVCLNDGLHAIVRYNIWNNSYGVGEVDAHGSLAVETREYAVGARCMEVYNNTFQNPDKSWDPQAWAINVRGGSGIIFNNTLIGHDYLVAFNNEYGNVAYQPKCSINETYIWNNNLGGGSLIGYNYGGIENVTYFLYPKSGYTTYPYPHPLTLEENKS